MDSHEILLVSPPFDFSEMNTAGRRGKRQGGYYLFYPPIGLCSVAASLERAGFRAGVIDGQAEAVDEAEFLRMIESARPGLVGFGVTTPALPVVRRLVAAVKERLGVPVMVGGPHVSCDPEITGALGADFGIVGDGEGPAAAVAGLLLRNKPPVSYEPGIYSPGAARIPQPALADLAEIPPPDRSLLRRPDAYFNPFFKARTTMLLTARGCAFRCSFCCRTPSMGEYRPLPEEKALAEMEGVSRGGYGFVSIIDETFTYDRERAMRLAREMRRRGFAFKWSCQTRADLIDGELLKEFAAAGCINISFGVESGDEAARENMEKRIPDAAFERAFSGCRRAGITTNAFIIIGGPDETPEEIKRSIRRAVELEPDYVVYNVGTLFPGTREYENRAAAGEISREVWDRYMRGETPMPALSKTIPRGELAAHLRRGYSKFYLRPRYVLKKIASLRSPRDVLALARQARTVVSDYVVS
jgi:radical SAM superfamily enzyme YgiQ (UPF0313 family)